MLFFHGNGELAADYDDLSSLYTRLGLSMWVLETTGGDRRRRPQRPAVAGLPRIHHGAGGVLPSSNKGLIPNKTLWRYPFLKLNMGRNALYHSLRAVARQVISALQVDPKLRRCA